ncbi:MAG: helix-turn-helix transcriptional regulator [Clostridia bacterium]|nr:helix-turn-helix transcriptional regulator [Clostridia bacterium]
MYFENNVENIFIEEFDSFAVPVHLHRNAELIICTAGTLEVYCRNETKILNRGDIMIAFPYDIHSYTKTAYGKGIMLVFNPEVSRVLAGKLDNRDYSNFASDEELIDILHNLCTEFEADSSFLTMYGYLHIVIGSVMRQLTVTEETEQETDLFSEALKYILCNYTKSLTLKIVCTHLGVSHQHLSRLFSEKVPGGFCRYLHILRVDKAKELLEKTDAGIYEILLECGFTGQRTFDRVFKELTGMTPRGYRLSCHKKSLENEDEV